MIMMIHDNDDKGNDKEDNHNEGKAREDSDGDDKNGRLS